MLKRILLILHYNSSLKLRSFGITEWFYENCVILNPGKFHFISFGKDDASDLLYFCGEGPKASEREKTIKVNFESHIKTLCSKASQELGTLQRP